MGAVAAPDPLLGNEAVLANLKKDVDENGDGMYRVTIRRRVGQAGGSDQMAIFQGVGFQQIADFEIWLGQLIDGGGGNFQMAIARVGGMGTVGGGFLTFNGARDAAPRPFNFGPIASAKWLGPRTLVFPPPPDQAQRSDVPGLPPTTPTGASSQMPSSQGSGGGIYSTHFAPPPFGSGAAPQQPRDLSEAQIYMAREREAMRDRAHAAEMAALRAAADGQIRELKSEFQQVLAELRRPAPIAPPPPKTDIKEVLMGLGAVLGSLSPFVDKFVSNAKEERQLQRERDERAAAARATAEVEMAKLNREMMDKFGAQNAASQAAFAAMSDASAKMVQTYSQMALNQTAAMMELQSNQQGEPGWVVALEKLADPIGRAFAAKILADAPANAPANANAQAGQVAQQMVQQGQQQLPPAEQQGQPQQSQQPPGNVRQISLRDRILAAISRKAPSLEVAELVFAGLQDKDLMQEVGVQFGGNVAKLFEHHLGPWLRDPANAQYLEKTINDVLTEGQRRGILSANPPGQPPPAAAPAAQQTVPVAQTPAAPVPQPPQQAQRPQAVPPPQETPIDQDDGPEDDNT